MSLFDTIDGVVHELRLRLGLLPARCARSTTTSPSPALSVAVALIIGTIEIVSILVEKLDITDGPLAWIGSLDLNYVGFAIVGLFVLTWVVALAVWHFGKVEAKWSQNLKPVRPAITARCPRRRGRRPARRCWPTRRSSCRPRRTSTRTGASMPTVTVTLRPRGLRARLWHVSDSSLTDKAAAAVDDATDTPRRRPRATRRTLLARSRTREAGDRQGRRHRHGRDGQGCGRPSRRDGKAAWRREGGDGQGGRRREVRRGQDRRQGRRRRRRQARGPAEVDGRDRGRARGDPQRLAGRIDDLTDYVKPANIVERQKNKLKSVFVDEYGGIKPDRVLMAAGIVVAVIGLGVLRRRRRRT